MVLGKGALPPSGAPRPPLPILFVQHLMFLSALGVFTIVVAATGIGRCGVAGLPDLVLDHWDGFQIWTIVMLHGAALTAAGVAVERFRFLYQAALTTVFLLASRKPFELLTERACASRGCSLIGLDEASMWVGASLAVSVMLATGLRAIMDAKEAPAPDIDPREASRSMSGQIVVVAIASLIFGFGLTMATRSRCLIDMNLPTHVVFFVHLDLFFFSTLGFVAFMTHIRRRAALELVPGALALFAICSGLVLWMRKSSMLSPIRGLESADALTSVILIGIVCIGSAVVSWALVLPFLPAKIEAPTPREPESRERRNTAREPLNRPRKDSMRGVIQRPAPDEDWES